MKKVFSISLALLLSSVIFSYACGGAGYSQIDSRTVRNCHVSFKFFGLVEVWSGSITTTITYQNQLTGETCQTVSSTGCGVAGGSWDWFWE